jgi:dipeptidyl aminopeptidase/acylaminoacyl peptidase
MLLYFIILFIIIIFFLWNYLIDQLIFRPIIIHKINDFEINDLNKFTIKSKDNHFIDGYILENNSDYYILFVHGNNGNVFTRLDYASNLLVFGNVVMFDYRIFKITNETEMYYDMEAVWNYLTNIKKIDPYRIILYGESTGCCLVTWLVEQLLKEKKQCPKCMILQSAFTSLYDLIYDNSIFLSYFISNKINTYENLKKIDGKIKTLIIHSKNDDIIPYHHAFKLLSCKNTTLYTIFGSHYEPKYPIDFTHFVLNFILKI